MTTIPKMIEMLTSATGRTPVTAISSGKGEHAKPADGKYRNISGRGVFAPFPVEKLAHIVGS